MVFFSRSRQCPDITLKLAKITSQLYGPNFILFFFKSLSDFENFNEFSDRHKQPLMVTCL